MSERRVDIGYWIIDDPNYDHMALVREDLNRQRARLGIDGPCRPRYVGDSPEWDGQMGRFVDD